MNSALKPAFSYYRVSSKAQSLEDQKHAVERAALAHGYELVVSFEEKQTAKYLKRPELDRLRAAARAGELPARLYVFRYDRLTRSGIRDTLNLIHELKEAGIEVWSVSDGFPLSGPVGDFVLAGLAFGAQLERLSGDERRAASRTRRKEQGLPLGRPQADPGPARRDLAAVGGAALCAEVCGRPEDPPLLGPAGHRSSGGCGGCMLNLMTLPGGYC